MERERLNCVVCNRFTWITIYSEPIDKVCSECQSKIFRRTRDRLNNVKEKMNESKTTNACSSS